MGTTQLWKDQLLAKFEMELYAYAIKAFPVFSNSQFAMVWTTEIIVKWHFSKLYYPYVLPI